MTSRVLVIGLDAACFEALDPLVESGAVPTLAGLIDRGVAAPLATTAPPWTPSAWPSVVTGSTPFVHGVYDFHQYRGGEPELVSARDVRVPFVWETLSAAGHRSVVVNVPVTHPPHAFDGCLVPGYLAPEGVDCLVDGRVVPMAELDPEYTIYARETATRDERLAEYDRLVDSRVRMARTLADRTPDWAFMMVQFQSTDAVFHTDGDDRAAVERVYRRVDTAVSELLDLAGEDATVLVVSDHGIKQYERVVYLNAWLRETGRLTTAAGSKRHVWNERSKAAVAGEPTAPGAAGTGLSGNTNKAEAPSEPPDDTERTGATGHHRSVVERAAGGTVRALSRVGLTPERVERGLARVGLDETVARLLPESALIDVVDAAPYVDRERSAAYCRSLSALGVRCNVAGRDPGGVIPAAEFDDFRRTLIAELRALRAPDGTRVFDAVIDRHDAAGPAVANERDAPDVLLRPAGMDWKVSDVVRERVFGETNEYSHSWTGLLVAAGPGIDADTALAVEAPHPGNHETVSGGESKRDPVSPSVVDVVPTVLARFGVPPPATVEGQSLFEPVLTTAPVSVASDRTTPRTQTGDRNPADSGREQGNDTGRPTRETGLETDSGATADASPAEPGQAAPVFVRQFLASDDTDTAGQPGPDSDGDERADRDVEDVVTARLREMGYLE